MRNLGKCPECLQRFHVEWQGKSSRKSNFFDFESPDSAISQFPMTLMKSMASLHQGPKASKAKPLNTLCDEIILYLLCLRFASHFSGKT
jgi:hypothetical protein